MGDAFAFPTLGDHVTFNDPDIQAAEIPGVHAHSLAPLHAACVGPVDGSASVYNQTGGIPDDRARLFVESLWGCHDA